MLIYAFFLSNRLESLVRAFRKKTPLSVRRPGGLRGVRKVSIETWLFLLMASLSENLLQAIQDKIAWCKQQRSLTPALPTVPSTIQEEKTINPFMRVSSWRYLHSVTWNGNEISLKWKCHFSPEMKSEISHPGWRSIGWSSHRNLRPSWDNGSSQGGEGQL